MLEGNKYTVESEDQLDALLKSLSQSYIISEQKSSNFNFSLYDTFSWDLFRKKKYFYSVEDKFYLQSFSGRKKRIKISYKKHYLPNEKIANFEPVKKIANQRAVSRQAKWNVKRRFFFISIKSGIKIAKIYFENFTFKTQSVLIFRVVKTPEYQEDFEFINTWAKKNNFVRIKNNLVQILLNKRNIFPLRYTSKIHLESPPDTPVFLAVRELFEKGRNNLLANFKGVKKDLDTEYLHDFRTTTRRLKSAISQFKDTCHSRTYEKIKYHLTYLQKSTNQLRDLDVDLISKKEYQKIIPIEYVAELNQLFDLLETKRALAFEEFMEKVDNLSINDSIQELNSFIFHLYPNNKNIPEKALAPVKENADKILKDRFQKIVKQGQLLNEYSDDNEIHKLRLDCKKLRYSLEFFINYYPEKRINSFIIRLKKLQDNLGQFNDLSVQMERLEFFKTEFNSSHKLNNIFDLLFKLKTSNKAQIRNEFLILLKKFLSRRTENSFYRLFTN